MQHHDTPDTLAAALAWQAAGYSVVRVALDGTKSPLGQWKAAQERAASVEELRAWFATGHPGIGVVTGYHDLEMLEFEGRAIGLAEQFRDRLGDADPTLWHTVFATGYVEITPSGGLHLYYRVTGGVDGNTKLARRPGPLADGRPTVETLIETRGARGFSVVAPSGGPVHPTGGAWRIVTGTPASIPTITAEQRDTLHLVARTFDAMPAPAPIPEPVPLDRDRRAGEIAPGEDFNARASWSDVLTPHGWTPARSYDGRTYWTRPGKRFGISAVSGGGDGDYLYVWSTSTELPAEEALSKWRVYALLDHAGDFSAAASALRRKGYGSPITPPTRPVFTVLPGIGATALQAAAPAPASSTTTYAHSDDGNALALVDEFGHRIRYCADRGRWLHWTGIRWEWCASGGGAVREYAKVVARQLGDDTPAAARHKARSLGAIGTTSMLIQAATDPRVVVTLDQLDAHAWELNTPAGIVNLRTGELHPADPARLHTRVTTASPDPDADPGRWLEFLADTFAGHDELPAYLQRLVGYSVTGVVREHVLPFAFGPGANGKGVFLETLRAVLGDYATTAPNGFLMAQKYSSHETEIARLAGARMVVCSEVNDGDRFDEAKVKQLTGGDALTARFMRQDHFTFQPTHKLWLMGNYQPSVNGGGHSFWRRLRILPFNNTVPEEKQVEDLQGILARDHGGAVLAWIIAGAAAYANGGLAEPESVRAATAEYAHDQNTVARFLEDCCRIGGGDHVQIKTSIIRAAYERWCHGEGVTPVTATAFGRALRREHGIGDARTGRARFYTNVTLLDDPDDDQGDENASPNPSPDDDGLWRA